MMRVRKHCRQRHARSILTRGSAEWQGGFISECAIARGYSVVVIPTARREGQAR
jgi:hypothetical protein